jgi:hypothetical protein
MLAIGRYGSTWGTVHPHVGQKSAPSGASRPQCKHAGTSRVNYIPYIIVLSQC